MSLPIKNAEQMTKDFTRERQIRKIGKKCKDNRRKDAYSYVNNKKKVLWIPFFADYCDKN